MGRLRLLLVLLVGSAAACGPDPSPGVGCGVGLTNCAGGCVNLQSSIANCGACDNLCSGGLVCSSGRCVPSAPAQCSAGLTNCFGVCTDVVNDRGNCGACGNACASGQTCGGGQCRSNSVDASVPPRDVPTPPPDTAPTNPCAGAFSCGTCTPIAGCGWCVSSARCVAVNASCTGPAAGSCGAGWACRSTECDPNVCSACRSDGDCPSSACGIRSCDGARACVPTTPGVGCDTVGGLVCPTVSMYRQCTADAQCGPSMHCIAVWPGQTERVCARPCTDNSQCPSSPAGGVGVAFCGSTDHYCHLSCSRAGACDVDISCRTATLDGAYRFCL